MAAPFNGPLVPFATLTKGQKVRITALDPADGSVVTGVVTTNMVLGVGQEDTDLGGNNVPLSGKFLPGT